MKLTRLAIRVRPDQSEIALAALLPILQNGAEEVDSTDAVEYVLYAPFGELPSETDIRELAGEALLSVELSDVPDGWQEEWKRYVQPVVVESGGWVLRLRAPWHESDPEAWEVVIDPGYAFGMGTHATTRLVLELLLEEERPGGALCDWGAGSGVLAIAAAAIGYGPVTAVEVQPDALETILANAAANGVSVTTKWLNLAATPAPWAPTVLANVPPSLLEWAAEVVEEPPERMIVSGVTHREVGALLERWAAHGLTEAKRRVEGEWVGLVLERA